MNFEFHIYHHHDDEIVRRLERIESLLIEVLRKEIQMALAFQADLDALTAQVAVTTDAEESAIKLLDGLVASQKALQDKLDAAIAANDPAAIAAAQKQIQDANALLASKTSALAAAIVQDTPAAPTP